MDKVLNEHMGQFAKLKTSYIGQPEQWGLFEYMGNGLWIRIKYF